MKLLKRLWLDESGQESAEYPLLLLLIATCVYYRSPRFSICNRKRIDKCLLS
jgi:hypothetical protein